MGVRRAIAAALTIVSVTVAAACASDDPAPGTIKSIDAYTAIVRWQATEQGTTTGSDGSVKLPVVFVVAADGSTIDVGIQATVTEALKSEATVRFADRLSDAFDASAPDAPVRESGTLVAIGPVPPGPRRSMRIDVDRYLREGLPEQLLVTVVPTTPNPNATIDPNAPVAVVRDTKPRSR